VAYTIPVALQYGHLDVWLEGPFDGGVARFRLTKLKNTSIQIHPKDVPQPPGYHYVLDLPIGRGQDGSCADASGVMDKVVGGGELTAVTTCSAVSR